MPTVKSYRLVINSDGSSFIEEEPARADFNYDDEWDNPWSSDLNKVIKQQKAFVRRAKEVRVVAKRVNIKIVKTLEKRLKFYV